MLPCLAAIEEYVRSNAQLESLQLCNIVLGTTVIANLMPALYRRMTQIHLDLQGSRLVDCGPVLRDLVRRNNTLVSPWVCLGTI